MSQLETNTTTMNAILEALQGKAAGGGAAVETCTGTLMIESPVNQAMTVYYTNGDMQQTSVSLGFGSSESITAVKNTLLVVNYGTTRTLFSGLTYIGNSTIDIANGNYGFTVYRVDSDGFTWSY